MVTVPYGIVRIASHLLRILQQLPCNHFSITFVPYGSMVRRSIALVDLELPLKIFGAGSFSDEPGLLFKSKAERQWLRTICSLSRIDLPDSTYRQSCPAPLVLPILAYRYNNVNK